MKNNKFWVYTGLFYCAFIWGSTFVVTKWALNSVNPVVMVAIRFFISALCLLPFVYKKNLKSYLKEGFILSIFLSLLYITQTIGLVYTTASNSGFITGLFIIFIPIFLFIFKKKVPDIVEILSSIIAIVGMWLLTGGIEGINKGDYLTLLAAMSYSAHLLFTDKFIKKNFDVTLLAFQEFWMVSLISFIFAFLSDYSFSVSGLNGWLVIIFLALFPTLSAFFIQMKAQKYVEPFKVGIIFCFEPVFAAIFAFSVGGEEFLWRKFWGGFFIFISMVVVELDMVVNLKKNYIILKKEVL